MELSNRIRLTRPLATTAMHGRVEALQRAGQPIIDLSIALSNFPAPDAVVARIREGLAAAGPLPYTAVVGAANLCDSLVKKLKAENHITADATEIIVTNGAKQAVYEALYVLTDPNDEVIIFRPYWPAYMAIAELLGLKPILVDLPDVVTAQTLALLPPAKVIILNSPHNPTGRVFCAAEMACLRDWISSNGSYAVCDESYEKLIFEGEHISLAAISDWRKLGVVSIFSASQSYGMMGWRVGFAVASSMVIQGMEALQGPITAAASAMTQLAAEGAFSSGTRNDMLEDYRARKKISLDLFADVPWITMQDPKSGPYLWGDISSLTTDTITFAETLLEQEKIAIMPGDALGSPGWIRLSFISDTAETLRAGTLGIIRHGNRLATTTAHR